jgi:hypothetical protein
MYSKLNESTFNQIIKVSAENDFRTKKSGFKDQCDVNSTIYHCKSSKIFILQLYYITLTWFWIEHKPTMKRGLETYESIYFCYNNVTISQNNNKSQLYSCF